MSEMTPLQIRVRNAAMSMGDSAQRQKLSHEVRKLTADTLTGWGAMDMGRGGEGTLGLESLGEGQVPTRNKDFNASNDANPEELMKGLVTLGMGARHVEQVTESVMTLLDGPNRALDILRGGYNVSGGDEASMSLVVGRTSANSALVDDNQLGTEAFGSDIDRLNTDDRLSVALTIMRPWENIMDKGFARVNQKSPVVTITVPMPEVYDWSATQKPNSTAAERNVNTPLRDLYRNPSRVNTAAKKVKPIVDNDTGSASLVTVTGYTGHYKAGREVSTLDLSRNNNQFGYHQVDRTDIISDGGMIENILVCVTDPSNSNLKEYFKLNTRAFALSMFTTVPANKTAGQRQVNMPCVLPITATTKQGNGSPSVTAAKFTDADLLIKLQFNANLNLQTGLAQGGGSANKELKQRADASSISSQTNTLSGQLLVEIVGYELDISFNEENQRKANLAVWAQFRQMQFVVPRSRVFFTEYSLTQEVNEDAISATSTVIALGNGRRGLDILVNRLNDVSLAQSFVQEYPEIAAHNPVDDQSFVSSLVKPTVLTTEINFDDEELNVMNESTRLSEIHGRLRARLLSMCTQIMANSLMLNQYKGGETPVFKVFGHSTIIDIAVGITDYHPDLKDIAPVATDADYSFKLPNGYRLDFIKSNMDCLKDRLYGVPVMEREMGSLMSAASIRDCGMVTTNYTPTNGGSVVRRIATTTREILMMSNPVGFTVSVQGLAAQLAGDGVNAIQYGVLPLGADTNDALVG